MCAKPYWYDLPPEKIAQRPCHPYDAAKMCVVKRSEASIEDSSFQSLAEFLQPGDLLVMNNTKVIPARLFGHLDTGARIEILLEHQVEPDCWQALGKPLKKLKEGNRITFTDGLSGTVLERVGTTIRIQFESHSEKSVSEELEEAGTMPIPPYIRKGISDEQDSEDYQTHFARHRGSIAAPTASLHFTPELMANVLEKGIQKCELTLHVGTASFLPLFEDQEQPIRKPGEERYVYSTEVLRLVKETRAKNKRVIAVGTTTVRALESMCLLESEPEDGSSLTTELFITPGFAFQAVDVLITNFHQPGTTHLLLVEAFLGCELLANVYQHALQSNYRFLSYGDGMLLV